MPFDILDLSLGEAVERAGESTECLVGGGDNALLLGMKAIHNNRSTCSAKIFSNSRILSTNLATAKISIQGLYCFSPPGDYLK
jgi:hypothetical protein